MHALPVAWRLQGEPALLVGGGSIALRKARLLCRAGARLRVVAPDILPELAALVAEQGSLLEEPFRPEHLEGMTLVVCATDDEAVNRQVSALCRAARIPVNVVDAPELCSFLFPAIVDRDPLLVSISTGGASPVLARWLRSRIESLVPARWGELAQLFARFRRPVAARLPSLGARRLFWERQLEGPVVERVLAGHGEDAARLLQQALDAADPETLARGEVYLVGAGPGDPDLMTFRALRLLQKADVVLYDRLVSPGILELARRDAELIYVGKQRSHHVVSQGRINELLVEHALAGRKVCRLKGGDPFIFGRGGEELEQVVAAGIPIQVVPGITAASGCAAYAGIPLTHRDHAQSVRFVTGHRRENGELVLPWSSLVTSQETLVFYMGLVSLPAIVAGLTGAGMPASTPAAVISQGTTAAQKVVVGTLATLPERVAAAELEAPALVMVGSVVTLHGQFDWFAGQAQES